MKTLTATIIAMALGAGASQAAATAAGKAAYDTSCKSCHGVTGTANPAIAKMMKVDMKDLGSPEVKAMSDADLKAIIANGKGKMHAITAVSGATADDVVAHVRTFSK